MYGEKRLMNSHDFEVVIGLEIHAQMKTKTKMFSPDLACFDKEENKNIHPISLGLPGTLPLVNKQAILFAIQTAQAFKGKLQNLNRFARKNYFYPDLPKGYQISQHTEPFCQGGEVEYHRDGVDKKVPLERIHMEEDAGQSLHKTEATFINLNRAGVPLLEIVTQPEIYDPVDAALCAKAIRQVLLYLDVCDGNLEEGSMRCDCNVSLRPKGSSKLGVKVELKNINSFRFIEKALHYEIKRQTECLLKNTPISQETRLYNSSKNQTFSMRSKETASDYRYFSDPDLLPLDLTPLLKEVQPLPELPQEKFKRFKEDYKLNDSQTEMLIENSSLSKDFEDLAKESKDPQASCHWITGEWQARLKETSETKEKPLSIKNLSQLIQLVAKETISISMAKEIFALMWGTNKTAAEIMKEKNLKLISDTKELRDLIQTILKENEKQVADYKNGRVKLFGFFVGQIMKKTKGQAHPQKTNLILKEELEK